jgi:hypothetical protein
LGSPNGRIVKSQRPGILQMLAIWPRVPWLSPLVDGPYGRGNLGRAAATVSPALDPNRVPVGEGKAPRPKPRRLKLRPPEAATSSILNFLGECRCIPISAALPLHARRDLTPRLALVAFASPLVEAEVAREPAGFSPAGAVATSSSSTSRPSRGHGL